MWKYSIFDNKNLSELYPDLYNVCHKTECTVEEFSELNPINDFHRRLSSEVYSQWNTRVQKINYLARNEHPHKVFWLLDNRGTLVPV